MIFAGIGIVVLVISFVIALVTLIREQSVIDDEIPEPEAGRHGSVVAEAEEKLPDALYAHKKEELSTHPEPLGQPVVSEGGSDSVMPLVGVDVKEANAGVSDAQKPHVWWEQLGDEVDKSDETNEDQESIEKIRAELAKLMSTKSGILPEEGLAAEKRQNKPQSGGLTAETLAGEFSLREIKKKD